MIQQTNQTTNIQPNFNQIHKTKSSKNQIKITQQRRTKKTLNKIIKIKT